MDCGTEKESNPKTSFSSSTSSEQKWLLNNLTQSVTGSQYNEQKAVSKIKVAQKALSAPGIQPQISLTDLSSSQSEPARFSSTFIEAISKQVCGLAGPSQAKATE